MQTTNKQSLTIDIRKRSLSSNFIEKTNVSQYIPQFVQGDTNILEAVIKDDGVDADLSNVGKVVANFKRQDRTVVSRSATKTGNVVTYTMGNEEMAKSGIGELELQFYNADDTERISTLRFKVNVMAEIGVGLEGEDGPTLVQELVFNGQYAKQAADSAITNWLPPVASYSAVTSIPNPKLGDTVQTNDTGYVYRYENGSWKNTQQYGATALANVNAQLAEKATKGNITSQDLKTSTDAEKIKLVNLSDEVKQTIAGTTSINATPADFTLTTEKHADNSITAKKVDFVKKSSNLFNKNTVTPDKTLNGSTGELLDSVGNNASDFIPIFPNTIYIANNVARRVFYDKNKTFISSYTNAGSFTSPVNAYFIRVVVGTINLGSGQLNLGQTLLPYESFYEELKTENLPNIPSKKIPDGTIGIKQIDFIKSASTNLFNKGKVSVDKSLSSLGELVDNTLFSTSDFIEVEPNTTFTINIPGNGRYAWYKSDKTFDASWFITAPKTFTTGSLVKYLRIAVPKANIDEAQLNLGSELLKYEPYALSVNGVNIYGGANPNEKTLPKFVIDGELDGVFNSPAMESKADGTSDPLFTKTAAQMISHYDDLMNANPNYITKTLLGNDSIGNPISRYDFKPAQPGDLDIKIPKVIITCATHGSEKAGAWTAYQTLKQITENWSNNPILDYLRWHIHFVVVPIVNPSGFNAYTRKNSNGVDVNRNFPDYWELGTNDPSELTYRGTAPLSELEAQYMDNLLKNEKDVIYVCDFHNFTTPPENKYFIWNPASGEFNAKISNNLISKMSRKWKSELAYLPSDTFFGYSTIFKAGTLAQRAYTNYGIESSTFEICERFMLEQPAPVSFSALTFKMGVDAFTNWLALVIKNNISMINNS